jgi:DNA-binding MarR family transcriptional regulator
MSLKIAELLFAHHTRISRITSRLALPSSLIDIHLLNALIPGPRLSSDLSEMLALAKSVVSRRVEALSNEGLLEVTRDKRDGRAWPINITSQGLRTAYLVNVLRSLAAEVCIHPLSTEERSDFISLLSTFADRLQAPNRPSSPGSSALLLCLERLSYAFGIIGGSFLGNGVSIEEFQILARIHAAALAPSTLAKQLSTSPSALSRSLASLEKAQFIVRSLEPNDRRSSLIGLSDQGLRIVESGFSTIDSLLGQSLIKMGEHEQAKLTQLLTRYVDASDSPESVTVGSLEFFVARKTRERSALRAFYVLEMGRRERLLYLPERLFAQSSICIGIKDSDRILGAAEYVHGQIVPELAAFIPSEEFRETELKELCLTLARAFFLEGDTKQHTPPRNSVASSYLPPYQQ